jgi:serine/threonine protein kinase
VTSCLIEAHYIGSTIHVLQIHVEIIAFPLLYAGMVAQLQRAARTQLTMACYTLAHDDMIGTRVGQYTIFEKIGEGGMGAVWRAHDEKLGRTVALKFLTRTDSPESRARFTQEARAASSLNHPGIVTIHDILDHGDKACIVMEFVEGLTLTRVVPAEDCPSVRW